MLRDALLPQGGRALSPSGAWPSGPLGAGPRADTPATCSLRCAGLAARNAPASHLISPTVIDVIVLRAKQSIRKDDLSRTTQLVTGFKGRSICFMIYLLFFQYLY